MISSLLSRSLLRRAAPLITRRRFAGGHHGGHGGMDMPRPRSMDAELWGGHSKEPEGWETILYVTYGLATIMILCVNLAPDTSIQGWARDEAQARLAILAKDPDFKFQFGTHYNLGDEANYAAYDKFYDKSTRPGEDDDDDEEEEAEEDDDEDE